MRVLLLQIGEKNVRVITERFCDRENPLIGNWLNLPVMNRAPKRVISLALAFLIAIYGSITQSQQASAVARGAARLGVGQALVQTATETASDLRKAASGS